MTTTVEEKEIGKAILLPANRMNKTTVAQQTGLQVRRLLKQQLGKRATTSVNKEIRFERGDYFGLVFPTPYVKLVHKHNGRSPELPAPCDACERPIESYPFVAKRHHSYRTYHLVCALRVGVVLPLKLDKGSAEEVFDWLVTTTRIENTKLYDVSA
jgi:hypothetical protein